MDKRFLQTMVICFAISIIYMDWITPERTVTNVPPSGVQQPAPVPTPGDAVSDLVVDADPGDQEVVPEVVIEEQMVLLANPLLEVQITNRGAALLSAVLPVYGEDIADDAPLELISPDVHSGRALEVQVQTTDEDLAQKLWEVIDSSPAGVTFRTQLTGGRAVVRSYQLPTDGYELFTSITFEGQWPVATDVRYEILGAERIRYDVSGRMAAYPNQWVTASRNRDGSIGDVDHRAVEAVETGEVRRDGIAWVGLESNYFAQVIRPLSTEATPAPSLAMLAYGARPGENTEHFQRLADGDGIQAPLQGWPMRVGFRRKVETGTPHQYAVFLGPKSPMVLEGHASWDAMRLIDYGFFGWLVRPFLWLLRTFDGFVGSWGLSIILLTFCIRGVLHPVNKRNQRQMQIQQQGMARLKPQMEEIKERYKNDAPQQQRKIQELFKSEGVNPAAMFGGCLFIFLQLPIWLALINTFTIAIELRQASFLWVDDLTSPDMLAQMPFSLPILGNWFNLLPILYVIVTLVNQKMMPQSDDPQVQMQQKMMAFMMVAFGFIFYSFAAGLMVYFITSALVGIIEQKMIRRDLRAAGILPTPGVSTDSGPAPGPGTGKSAAPPRGPARPGSGKVKNR